MTEEINNLNTDLKDLFVNSEIEKSFEIMDNIPTEIALELTLYNYDIIKKYFDSEKYTVLFQHIKFVAYSSFLCEYSINHQIIKSEDYESMASTFTEIYNLIKQNQ